MEACYCVVHHFVEPIGSLPSITWDHRTTGLVIRTNQGRVISQVWIHSMKSAKPLFGSTLSEAQALAIDRSIATYILRFIVEPEKANETTELTWFELFDLTEKMYRRFQTSLTSNRMAKVLVGLVPCIQRGELDASELVKRPKFFKAASLLGARYIPQSIGDSFATSVYESRNITRPEKRRLYEWMVGFNLYTTNPFKLFDLAEILTTRTKKQTALDYLVKLPFEKGSECDEYGFNLLHFAANIRKPLGFYRAITHLESVLEFTNEEIADMMLKKSCDGVTPLAKVLVKLVNSDYILFPDSVTTAIRRIIATADLELIKPVFTSHVPHTCKPFILYLYASGVTAEMFHKVFGSELENPFEDPELMATRATYKSSTDSVVVASDTSFNLDQLLPELVFEIALSVEPDDLLHFFTVTKYTVALLRQPNIRFWNEYHARHYRPLNIPCPSLKQRIIQEVRGRVNWQAKKYHEIKFEDCRFSVMDDNWMLLYTDNTAEAFYHGLKPYRVNYHFWNCQTQQMHDVHVDHEKTRAIAKLILSNYSYGTGTVPAFFGEDSRLGKYQIVRGQEVIDCKAVQEFMVGRSTTPHFYINYELIDHRMFISERAAMYDPEHDKIVGQLNDVTPFHFTTRFNFYLPISRQILVLNRTFETEIYDLNYNKVSTIPFAGGDRIPVQVDEHTLFYPLIDRHEKSGFLDLRMNQFVEFLDDHIKSGGTTATCMNGERIVFTHPMLQIVTSWNLRTRRWEFVDDNWFYPSACNHRYLVGYYGSDVIVRDFCSNAIQYQ